MKIDVLISAAGLGSRMNEISSKLHKAILPFQGKPILHNLIENTPDNLVIGFLLGHKSEQILNFLKISYPDKKFQYVFVDDWTTEKSGTGYSLTFATDSLNDTFWYFPCDGVYSQMEFIHAEPSEDLFIISPIENIDADNFLTFQVEKSRVKSINFKTKTTEKVFAFTGAMRIANKIDFFEKLKLSGSTEFISVIKKGALTCLTDNWVDLGNAASYRKGAGQNEFDFSKPDEFTYQLDNSIIKWSSDSFVADAKKNKPEFLPDIFPNGISTEGEFLKYNLEQGETFYKEVNAENFSSLLDWLEKNVWIETKLDISKNLYEFYKNKTINRIDMLSEKKYLPSYNPQYVDGLKVLNWKNYLQNIDWNLLINEYRTTFIHGDLQFDNIIFNPEINKFTLIDWRHDFGGLKIFGDLYYDFAKLLGGIYQNYRLIKGGNLSFEFSQTDSKAKITVPSLQNKGELIVILKDKVNKMGLSMEKIELLVPLIYWNMSPLHKEPFANICWCLGLKYFEIGSK